MTGSPTPTGAQLLAEATAAQAAPFSAAAINPHIFERMLASLAQGYDGLPITSADALIRQARTLTLAVMAVQHEHNKALEHELALRAQHEARERTAAGDVWNQTDALARERDLTHDSRTLAQVALKNLQAVLAEADEAIERADELTGGPTPGRASGVLMVAGFSPGPDWIEVNEGALVGECPACRTLLRSIAAADTGNGLVVEASAPRLTLTQAKATRTWVPRSGLHTCKHRREA